MRKRARSGAVHFAGGTFVDSRAIACAHTHHALLLSAHDGSFQVRTRGWLECQVRTIGGSSEDH
eukprot:2104714-Rhodomonas_salina.1